MYADDDNDSYHEATEGRDGIRDDNRTATGTVKSYRKTPFASKYTSRATLNRGENAFSPVVPIDPRQAIEDEHRLLLHELFARLITDPQMGLSHVQATANLELHGPNDIGTILEVPAWVRFSKSLFGGSSIILWMGVVLSFANYSIEVGKQEYPPVENVVLGVALLIVISITGILSFIQETKSASLIRHREAVMPETSKVIREGEEQEVASDELVIGDIILLGIGERIPADCRVLESNSFMVDNASLTGESEPLERDIHCTNDDLLLTKNMIFRNTYAVQGNCKAVVIRTGLNTIVGRMTEMTAANPKEATLISRELASFIHLATGVGIYMGVFFFIISFLLGYFWIDSILFLIGIIVANVPEGLLAVVTISLSVTAKRLMRRNCIVKNLETIETLGATSIILCDKTGTLTRNMATVAHVWFDNEIGEVDTGTDDRPAVSFDLQSSAWKNMARIAVLCNRAEFVGAGGDDREVLGTAIDSALLRNIEAVEGQSGTFRSLHPKVCEIPFNPIIKFQLSIHECHDYQQKGYLVTLVGDPEAILNRCSSAYVNGQERSIGDDYIAAFRYACTELGGLGERLVALADSRLSPQKYPPGFAFDSNNINFPLTGFRLIGIMSLIDPPRASVPDSIAKCQAAGIKVIMMTGDHPSTAKAIAKSVGILSLDQDPLEKNTLMNNSESCLITGEEMQEMSPEELENALMHHHEIILAGLSSEQKLDVVEACQRLGAIVAVTGDGVNDAAALRKADVGIAMGPGGTDIAKDAADVILMDNNFSSIVIAIEEGRIMFDNLRKMFFYTLASNMGELVPFVMFLFAQIPLPLGVLAVLCIDLGTDLLPGISLAFEEEETMYEAMKRGPRNPISDGIVTETMIFTSYGHVGLIQGAAGLFTYCVIMAENGFWPSNLVGIRTEWDSRAINDLKDTYGQEWTYEDRKNLEYSCHAGVFFSIVAMQWITLIISRTRKLSIFQRGMGNWVANFSIFFETCLAFLLIYMPGLNQGLQLQYLFPLSWFPPLPFLIILFVYEEMKKAYVRKHANTWIEHETCI
ncbi:hypothetical protein TCAL_08725 [Tigriopus californicus]|uniref:Sodium/potassium-transporting ATPase subunit alpha n=1 Tax=Tigriopus californicus TaxID=6832 RepID=A0A553NYT3_TIGCA|nr:sodium/potassium-transporting ATPase subunit alpha-B-like [Tigriopus californicus]TRY70575.1 hypothetical protein TCAL_08725 [Tigriopus californicus]|eukprot:TCALIF_08725-PA protein Name:"Similar to Atpalpha Sodium/potassium-transporting ATPase subunit alpha (Drosophila melanogaster)" AED:0.01 eAED:0.01 QI:0/-1/0/1/-1/1/1/0/1040